MSLAIETAQRSPEGSARVGVVIERGGEVVVKAFKGEGGAGEHAEAFALRSAEEQGHDVRGAAVFVTLEPCANLQGANKRPCSELLVAAKTGTVFIGSYDRNPRINRLGWRALVDGGVVVRDFDADMRERVRSLGETFDGYFLQRSGLSGVAKFDFQQNGGNYDLRASESEDAAVWRTSWTECGTDSVYLYGGAPGIVAHARYAREFSEVDDPEALDFESTSVRLALGEIGIMRGGGGHALVRVLEVVAGERSGAPYWSLKIDYSLRLASPESSRKSSDAST